MGTVWEDLKVHVLSILFRFTCIVVLVNSISYCTFRPFDIPYLKLHLPNAYNATWYNINFLSILLHLLIRLPAKQIFHGPSLFILHTPFTILLSVVENPIHPLPLTSISRRFILLLILDPLSL